MAPVAPAPISLVDRAGLDRPRLAKIISRGLDGADDGELFLEYRQAEMLVFDNGRLKQATYDTSQGFGLRAVKDEAVGYAHASDVSEAAIARAADAVRAVKGGYTGQLCRAAAARRTSSSMARKARSAAPRSRPRRGCSKPSTPMRGRKIRACARSRSAWAPPGRRSRSCAATARPIATCARWCASTSRSSSATATARRPAAPAMAAARAMSASSSPTLGSTRPTRRCARR